MGRKKHLAQLTEFKNRIQGIMPVERMILFGSRARGRATRWSDFDLLLVSSSFREKKFRERAIKLYDYWKLDYPVDFLCYTPEEFKKLSKQITLVRQAVNEGIEIAG